jgi:hypothetical protein
MSETMLHQEAPIVGEHPLDVAARTRDAAMRCYYWEWGDDTAGWLELSGQERAAMNRPPVLSERVVPSGCYYIYEGSVPCVCTREQAYERLDASYQAG